MQGNHEVDNDNYPVSYMVNNDTTVHGPCVDIFDMLNQKVLVKTLKRAGEVQAGIAEINGKVRKLGKKYTLEQLIADATCVAEFGTLTVTETTFVQDPVTQEPVETLPEL